MKETIWTKGAKWEGILLLRSLLVNVVSFLTLFYGGFLVEFFEA
jgi:hypothetical protein